MFESFVNYTATISGPIFLFILTIYTIILNTIAKFVLSYMDKSKHSKMPEFENLNKYEIAVLRGGKNALILTIIFDLYYRKNISLKRKRKQITISQGENTQKPENPLEKLMYYHVGVETYAKQIFKNLHIEPELRAIFNSLEKKHLRPSADKIFKNWVVVVFVILLILFLGITKLYCATVLNKPYAFLVIFFGLLSFFSFKLLKPKSNIKTKLGKELLKKLTTNLFWAKEDLKSNMENSKESKIDPAIIFAIYGIDSISSIDYFYDFYSAFPGTNKSHNSFIFFGDDGGCGGCGGGCSSGGYSSGGCSSGGCSSGGSDSGGGGCGGCGGS